jgi:N-acylneuraminate cytidylyltransferase/CMP-N,N'-diacetyllegionaminic acid synthase
MIAIIPARGGSKGLPGKNIKMLCGKPLIAYAIECAQKSRYIDRVIVSTDDERIAEVSKSFGAEVPFLRPGFLATDESESIDTFIYTIERLSREWNADIDEFAVLLSTAPLRTSCDVDAAIELYYEKNADSVVSYTEDEHPIQWHKYLKEDNSFENIFPDTITNRQALRKSYHPNGAIYVFKSDVIKERKYYTDRSFAYLMPRSRSVDIDTQDDFILAELMIERSGSRTGNWG